MSRARSRGFGHFVERVDVAGLSPEPAGLRLTLADGGHSG